MNPREPPPWGPSFPTFTLRIQPNLNKTLDTGENFCYTGNHRGKSNGTGPTDQRKVTMFQNRKDAQLFWSNQDLAPGTMVQVQTLDWWAIATVIRTVADQDVLVKTITTPTQYDGTEVPVGDRDPFGEYYVTAQTITQVHVAPTSWKDGKPF